MAIKDTATMLGATWEPIQKNRFICYMQGVKAYTIYKVSIPTIDHGEVVIDHINLKRYVKGRTVFSECNMSLYQPIIPSGARAVMDWSRMHHEEVTGRDGFLDFYKRDLTIEVLGPSGNEVQQFILKGAYIKTANFGEYDWTGEGLVSIDLTLRVDSVILNY